MSGESTSVLKRLFPLVKLAIAFGLIAFIIWLVPITDEITLPGATEEADRTIAGRIVDRQGTTARFESESEGDAAGEIITLTLGAESGADENLILSIESADGAVEIPESREEVRPRLNKGIMTVLSNASLELLLAAIGMIIAGSMLAIYRWTLLLKAAGVATGLFRAVSLTFIGLFFNNVMPGLTGGDLVKAVYIARDHSKKKTEAIITVLLDRVLGITGLAAVASLVIPMKFDEYAVVAPWIYGFLAVLIGGAAVFFSRRLRSAVRLDEILKKLPLQKFLLKINQAVFLYRFRKKAVMASLAISMVVHLIIITGISIIGKGIGLGVSTQAYFAIMPIVLIVMALPISPAGLGTGEAAAIYFWGAQGVSGSEAVSLLLVYRMSQLSVSLIGGVFLALQKQRITSEEMESFSDEEGDEESDGDEGRGGKSSGPPDETRRDASGSTP